jgi:hypothetical protein
MEIIKAKELFFHYKGSLFHMDREGDYEEYSKYNIDEETEKIWKEELIQLRLKEYKETSNFKSLYVLTDNNRYDLLDKIMETEIKGTLLNKIVIIELLTEFIYKNKIKINEYEIYKNKLIEYCNKIREEYISKEYLEYSIKERLNKIMEKIN